MKDLFHTLRTMKRDMRDTGMVMDDYDLAEEMLPEDVLPLESPAIDAFSEHALEPEASAPGPATGAEDSADRE
ncbi:MAG: hypothetical protein HN742_13520 [Lentisphaerae bacterium]|jgi:hypothetical protein|nr:hypothetical protein [Lentisphaerota bacterium]MBT4818933.1 hypothetical protein [Lentisphaerota bacterium]MBT5608233.1 hypothetical protein [Lentisphaerota bacterium]MBT7058878.1 hypothetical protein [Lentisphaerota bacterium]MBT7842891.1 hypothetical protein [Lentisphaerota bacterium]